MTTKTKKTCPGAALAASILGLALVAMPSSAATPPELTIAVAGSGSVTIDSTGAETYVAPCTAALCAGKVVVGTGTNGLAVGQLSWAGTIGTFTGLITGQTKPFLAPPQIDVLASGLTTGATGGTMTLSWTDVGFAVGESPATMNIVGGGGGSTVSYASYVDDTNVPFGTGILVGTLSGSGTVSGSGPLSNPFSMTNVETITLPANIGGSGGPPFSTDFSLQVSPHPPLSLQCGAAAGTVGTPYSSSLVANGGVPPYTYSLTGGSLSPLSLDVSTGAITGTPTVAGTLNFTA